MPASCCEGRAAGSPAALVAVVGECSSTGEKYPPLATPGRACRERRNLVAIDCSGERRPDVFSELSLRLIARREQGTLRMHSEYDFLSPYLRRLRRIAPVLAASGAVLAGAVSMALVVGLPLLPRSYMEATVTLLKNSPAADPSLNTPQQAADTAATAGSVGAALEAGSDSENRSTAANVFVETAT